MASGASAAIVAVPATVRIMLTMGRTKAISWAVAGVLLGLIVLVWAGRGALSPTARSVLEDWVAAMGGAEDDLGWHYLSAWDQEREWSSSQRAYADLVGSVDWAAMDWSIDIAHPMEGSSDYWTLSTIVHGGTDGLPAQLFARALMSPNCLDDERVGFAVVVHFPPFSPPTVGAGGQTGRMERGLCAMTMPPLAEQFLPGNAMTWTDHQLEVRNWTELPLFLVDDAGRRFDLGPCSTTGIDSITQVFEVRAADGYVATIGWGPPLEGVTSFVAIGASDVYNNNAPPIEPLPACEGEPLVQPGI